MSHKVGKENPTFICTKCVSITKNSSEHNMNETHQSFVDVVFNCWLFSSMKGQ